MQSEAELIASRLAVASQCFPLPHNDVDGKAVRDSVVYVESEGNFVIATMTAHDGAKTEYRARFVPINSETAPEPQVRQHPAGTASEHPTTR